MWAVKKIIVVIIILILFTILVMIMIIISSLSLCLQWLKIIVVIIILNLLTILIYQLSLCLQLLKQEPLGVTMVEGSSESFLCSLSSEWLVSCSAFNGCLFIGLPPPPPNTPIKNIFNIFLILGQSRQVQAGSWGKDTRIHSHGGDMYFKRLTH